MSIIIPSSKIFDKDTNKVLRNSLKQIEIVQNNVEVLSNTQGGSANFWSTKPAQERGYDTSHIDYDNQRFLYGYQVKYYGETSTATISRKKSNDTNYYVNGVSPSFIPTYKISINKYNGSYYPVSSTKYSIDFSAADSKNPIETYSITNEGLIYEISQFINDVSFSNKRYRQSLGVKIDQNTITASITTIKNLGNSSETFGLESYTITPLTDANVNCYPFKIETTPQDDIILFKVDWLPKLEVYLGACAFEIPPAGANPFSSPREIIKITFEAQEAKLIFGEEIQTIDVVGDEKASIVNNNAIGEDVISVGNDFIRTNNKYGDENATNIYQKTLNEYENGKETSIIECAISDYFDYMDNSIISTAKDKMAFEIYDEVVPYIKDANLGDVPMSLVRNKPKAFEVVGFSLRYDGRIRQKLHLQEKGALALPPTEGLKFTLYDNYYSCAGFEGIQVKVVILPSVYNDTIVKAIEKNAFWAKTVIKKVFLPDSIEEIKDNAFYSCQRLEHIDLGNNLININASSFYNCNRLKNITLPNTLQKIGGYAFCKCESLRKIIIPPFVSGIQNGAFISCSSLQEINVDSSNLKYTSFEGNLYTKDKKTIVQYAYGKNKTTFEVPYFVETIGVSCFENEQNIDTLIIYSRMKTIQDMAFKNANLKNIIFTGDESQFNSISVGDYNDKFNNATKYYLPFTFNDIDKETVAIAGGRTAPSIDSLWFPQEYYDGNFYKDVTRITDLPLWAINIRNTIKEINIPSNINYIGKSAFSNFVELKKVTFKSKALNIRDNAFLNCISLKEVYYSGSQKDWERYVSVGDGNDCLLNAIIYFNS